MSTTIVTCPACGSPTVDILTLKLDGVLLECCRKCGAFWEAELRDSPGSTPCDNCAWRPGSPERGDTEKWQALMADFRKGATFWCHKRIPATVDESGYSFDFDVQEKDGRWQCANAEVCAGWLAWKLGQIYKPVRKERA